MVDYKRLGAKARLSGASRESCRFRAPDIRAAWLAGWDERDRESAEAKRRRDEAEATLRWVDATSYSQGERGRVPPRCWSLRSARLAGWSVVVIGDGATWRWEIKLDGHLHHYREVADTEVERVRGMAIAELRTQIRNSIERCKSALRVLDEVPA